MLNFISSSGKILQHIAFTQMQEITPPLHNHPRVR